MIDFGAFDRRPVVVAIAGPNGAGKSTFFHAHLASAGLRFVNPDILAAELAMVAPVLQQRLREMAGHRLELLGRKGGPGSRA